MVCKGKQIMERTRRFLQRHNVSEIYRKCGFYNTKVKGIAVADIMLYLINLVFTKKSMYMNIQNGTHDGGFGKDTVYRFLKATCINWSMFLLGTSENLICAPARRIFRYTSSARTCIKSLLCGVRTSSSNEKFDAQPHKAGFRRFPKPYP